MDTRKLLAEAVGTFILVGVGSMSILAASVSQLPALLIAPFGFGLALLVAIAVAGHASGGHFNPAVTVGAWLDRRIELGEGVGYIIAQLVGAIGASGMVLGLVNQGAVSATRTLPGDSDLLAFGMETLLTAVFIAVILTVTKRNSGQAVFIIPITLVVIHFAGIPFSGASVNPARSLAPALVGADMSSIWVYLTAPFLGAIIGWIVYRALDDRNDTASDVVEDESAAEVTPDDVDAPSVEVSAG